MPRHRQHRNDENQVRIDKRAAELGMGIVKLSQTNVDGLPDRIYLNRGCTLWCEIKSDTGYGKKGLTKSQLKFQAELAKHGIMLYVIQTEDDLLKLKNGELK